MKKFKFQLATLLKVTRMIKEKAEVELAKATKILEEQRPLLKQYLEDMAKGQKDYDEISA